MKVILTGSTGFIGGGVLNECVQHPKITSIIVLSRRELTGPAATNVKTKVTVLEDFMNYPDSVLQQIKDADVCIWRVHPLGLTSYGV